VQDPLELAICRFSFDVRHASTVDSTTPDPGAGFGFVLATGGELRTLCIIGPRLFKDGASTMATEGYWADPVMERDRPRTQWPTLDSMIHPDDPVRLVDEVLENLDWSEWEAEYSRQRGQPPIHPRVLAGIVLYGMYRGIRSTRRLEEACCYRLDFMWLAEGRRIDHTTLSKFRVRFKEPLKDLFRQIGRIAIGLGLITLGEVAFDGTRVKANNSRYNTRTAKTLEAKLKILDEIFERMVNEQDAAHAKGSGLGSATQLPDSLADIEKRRASIAELLEKAREADETRRQQGVNPEKNPAQIPTTDSDSKVMPNKEGGYAPNYTPVATTDGKDGFILDADVLPGVNESPAAAASVDRIEENFGSKPEKFLTDGGNNAGQVMSQMEERGVEFYAPVESNQPQPGDPAYREDPSQPVPESEWPKMKRNSQGQLDKSNFVYCPEEDQYYCPRGEAMPFDKTKPGKRNGETIQLRIYRATSCEGCPLAKACLSPSSKGARTITRDPYEQVRERTAARMATPEGRAVYNRRPQIAETPFAFIKRVMGVRQFLLRGLEKVRTEWRWVATAFNFMKLVRAMGKLRAHSSNLGI